MLPYSGQISYGQIRDEFGGTSTFDLQNAYNGTYGVLNPYSYIQPINPGGANYSPNQWYGYDGKWIVTTSLQTNWDAWPTIGSYPGAGTLITDASGNNVNGTLYNGTGWTSLNGGAWVFDGVNDYVASSTPAFFAYTTEITVDFWIKYTAAINDGQGVGQAVYNNFDGPPPGQNMWLMHGNGGGSQTVTFYVWDNTFNVIGGATTSYLTTGNWYNIVCSMNSGGSTMYTNGTVTGTGGGTGGGMNTNPSAVLFMGGDVRYDFRRLQGSIAALKVYSTALSAPQITQNWNAIRGRFNL